MLLKYYKQIIIIILLIALFFLYKHSQNLKAEKEDLISAKELVSQKYKTVLNKNKELIVRQDVIEFNNKKAIDSLIKKIDFGKFKPKKPSTFIQEAIIVKLDSTYIKYDTVYLATDTIRTFKDSSKYFYISGRTNHNGVFINRVSFPMMNTTVISKQRYNIFKTKTVITIHHDNPLVSTEKLTSIVLRPEPNKLLKNLTRVLIFSTGVFLGSKL